MRIEDIHFTLAVDRPSRYKVFTWSVALIIVLITGVIML